MGSRGSNKGGSKGEKGQDEILRLACGSGMVASFHYCCCTNCHDASTCVCAFNDKCIDTHRCKHTRVHTHKKLLPWQAEGLTVSVHRCTLGQSAMWETLQLYYSIQIQMGLSGKLLLFITCQKNQGMDGAEWSKLNDSK